MGIEDIISLLGGLAFFLFGMSLLGEGLKRVAGGKLETILGRLTANRLMGVLLGAGVTAVIQSSSATTVMVVGFVNSGIMKLSNAVGIIMGANIGTTATGWILTLAGVEGGGFSSATMFALIAFVGIILYFFCKKTTQKNVGMILLAFSVLMSGMQAMSAAMEPLKTNQAFLDLISAASNPFVALFIGIVVTAVIQSASASIGILQALCATGAISYAVAVPMVVGISIGACVPVLLSAIGANVNGRRAALIYPYFNVLGALLLIPFYLCNALLDFGFMALPASAFGVAVANTAFNLAAAVVEFPFIDSLERLIRATVQDKNPEEDEEFEENLLDERFLKYPPLAIEQSRKTLERMSNAAFKNLERATELLTVFSREKYEKIMSREDRVDRYEDRLGTYLVRLNTKELSDLETQQTAEYLHCLTNLERISDHAVNLAELACEMADKHIAFSAQAAQELGVCVEAVQEIASLTKSTLSQDDQALARRLEPLEEVIDVLTGELKVRHINRLQAGNCTLELGFIFNDCINNFERVADHCSNIAVSVLEEADVRLQSHDYLRSIKQDNQSEYRRWLEEYEEKYDKRLMEINI